MVKRPWGTVVGLTGGAVHSFYAILMFRPGKTNITRMYSSTGKGLQRWPIEIRLWSDMDTIVWYLGGYLQPEEHI